MKNGKLLKIITKLNTANMKFLNCTVEWDLKNIKSAEGGTFIEGYANTVDKDRVGDVVLPNAFAKTLPQYMDNPVLLYQHDWDKVIGTVVDAKITDKGLFIKAKLSGAKDVDDVRTKIMEGALRTFSIGYNEIDSEFNEQTKTNVIKELELLEISVVTIPANAQSKFTVVGTQKTEGEGVEKSALESLIDTFGEGFKGYLTHILGELDADEEITEEFVKELAGIYKTFGENAPTQVKIERGQDESLGDCVSRAIPVLINEGKDQDQAVAIAYSMCEANKGGQGSGGARAGAGRPKIGDDDQSLNGPDKPKPSDVLKAPVIGRIVSKPMSFTSTDGEGNKKPLEFPSEEGDVIDIMKNPDGSSTYVLNSWNKPGVPQLIHSSMVESYEENANNGKSAVVGSTKSGESAPCGICGKEPCVCPDGGQKPPKTAGDVQLEHHIRTHESAWKACSAAMKELNSAHNECAKACGEKGHPQELRAKISKSMDTYMKGLEECDRSMKALQGVLGIAGGETTEPMTDEGIIEVSEDGKGGAGSGGARAGAGRKPGQGKPQGDDTSSGDDKPIAGSIWTPKELAKMDPKTARMIKRQARLTESRNKVTAFVKKSDAIKKGIADRKARESWSAHIDSLQQIKRNIRQGKSLTKADSFITTPDEMLDKLVEFFINTPADEASVAKFIADNSMDQAGFDNAVIDLILEMDANEESDKAIDQNPTNV